MDVESSPSLDAARRMLDDPDSYWAQAEAEAKAAAEAARDKRFEHRLLRRYDAPSGQTRAELRSVRVDFNEYDIARNIYASEVPHGHKLRSSSVDGRVEMGREVKKPAYRFTDLQLPFIRGMPWYCLLDDKDGPYVSSRIVREQTC